MKTIRADLKTILADLKTILAVLKTILADWKTILADWKTSAPIYPKKRSEPHKAARHHINTQLTY